MPLDKIIDAHKELVVPDLTIILDITMEEFEKRLAANGETHSEVFDYDKEFISKVREIYLQMPKLLPDEKIVFISSMEPFEEVHKKVIAEVEKILD